MLPHGWGGDVLLTFLQLARMADAIRHDWGGAVHDVNVPWTCTQGQWLHIQDMVQQMQNWWLLRSKPRDRWQSVAVANFTSGHLRLSNQPLPICNLQIVRVVVVVMWWDVMWDCLIECMSFHCISFLHCLGSLAGIIFVVAIGWGRFLNIGSLYSEFSWNQLILRLIHISFFKRELGTSFDSHCKHWFFHDFEPFAISGFISWSWGRFFWLLGCFWWFSTRFVLRSL